MFVCCESCVLSGRDLCDELITRPEESYRLWCVVVCDLENLKNQEAMTRVGYQHHSNKKSSSPFRPKSSHFLCCFAVRATALSVSDCIASMARWHLEGNCPSLIDILLYRCLCPKKKLRITTKTFKIVGL